MVDDSELDYIVTFLGKVHTGATVKHIQTAGKQSLIADTQKMLVLPGELISTTTYTYSKRFKVQISEATEAGLTTAINNIINGIFKFNTRQTIAGYTRETTMIHINLSNSTKAFYDYKTKRWGCDISLDIDWSLS